MVCLTNGDATLLNPATYQQPKVQEPAYTLQNVSLLNYKDGEVMTPQVEYSEDLTRSRGLNNINNKNSDKIGNPEMNLAANDVYFMGIWSQSSGSAQINILYNTVYIGGTQPGAGGLYSYGILRTAGTPINLRNNLIINARSGGLGQHFAISNESGSLYSGWAPTASNYNALLVANASNTCEWGFGNPQTITQWRTSTLGSDMQTWQTTSSTVSPSNLLTNIGTGDLHINSGNSAAWLVSGKGIALTGQNIDYDGNSRSVTIAGGVTDIGADEFAATPPSNPVATETNAPGSGVTSTYSLFGRTICVIDWGTGGVYPTSMNVNYYSGINPPNLGAFNANTGNSYWTANPVSGTLTGTTYDITYYFGDNETYTITSPNTNIILGKEGPTAPWITYGPGTGAKQTELNWAALTAKTRGLGSFSDFAMFDDAYPPSPLLVSPANNSTGNPASLTLVWRKSFGATSYKVQVASDSLFTTILVNDSTVTDSTKAVVLSMNNNYWWRVRGKNASGFGAYSEIFKFNTTPALTPPPPPVLFSPSNNAIGQNLSLTLVWFKPSTAASYRVQVATDSNFSSIILNDSTLTDSTRVISGLNPLTFYWWRVNAKNAARPSSYSTVFKFKTIGPPTQVTLLNPPNNATNQPIAFQFRWTRANDQTAPFEGIRKSDSKTDDPEVISNYWWEMVTDTVSMANLQRDTTLIDTTKNIAGLNNLTP